MRRFKGYSRSEEGSTLMLALMGLVFLTVIGLSLAVVTETEMLIGNNEQIANETFYAAEAALSTAVTQLLVENNLQKKSFAISAMHGDEDRYIGTKTLGYSIDFSAVYPVEFNTAAYSTANVGGGSEMFSVFFKTSARARRLAWEGFAPDCEGQRNGDGPVDEFADILAEEELDYAFFVTPITGIEIGALEAGHREVARLGCQAPLEDDENEVVDPPADPPPADP